MKIEEYVKKYTDGNRIHFFSKVGVTGEFMEFIKEIIKLNSVGMKEEWQDFLHFLQLWLYWRFGLNQNVWECTTNSINKFIERVTVWQKIYVYCGLPRDISGFAGNYNRIDKVINHLGKLGVSESKATEAYKNILIR
jgi:hypothetical protein